MSAHGKTAVPIRPWWYSDVWVFPKLITVITTLDAEGRLNAAPYSHVMQYDVMAANPRMIAGFRQDSHTFQNIVETGEFVINCPSADMLDDMMETARFYPAGVNELEHTSFTTIPSTVVKPPSIAQCPQIAECRVEEIVRLEKSSGIVIAKVEALVFDDELVDLSREDRIRAMNLPVGLGDESRQDYFHAVDYTVTKHVLGEAPNSVVGSAVEVGMPWDEDAMQALMSIPPGVRAMVTAMTETAAREAGDATVTLARMNRMQADASMTPDMIDRFRKRS
jgi:flavin reductase (DIM6/NTAB) family NADH-FMN oxidoreductase RutF